MFDFDSLLFRLDSLKEVHRARQAELRKMAGDVENATASLELLEDASSEIQLKFYRNMTLYIHNLVECLREKVIYHLSKKEICNEKTLILKEGLR